jgi:hypothetical protein
MKQLFLMIVIGACAFAQAPVEAKVAPTSPKVATKPPTLNTTKYWRLESKRQAARTIANQTAEGKAAQAAEDAVNAEVQELIKTCGADFVLMLDQDKNSKTEGDVICAVKPPDPPKK